MNLAKRISDLEKMKGIDDDRALEGVLFFHEKNIVINGKRYESINDIPKEVLEKHGEQFEQLKT